MQLYKTMKKEKKKEEEKKMKCTIVGVKKGKTKTGRECFNYYANKPFTDYDHDSAECIGNEVVSAFSYQDFKVVPGDEVDFRYEPGFEGKATLTDIVVVIPCPVKSTNK